MLLSGGENDGRGAPADTRHLALPHELSRHAAAEVVGRYLSTYGQTGAGSDWVDVVPLSGGRVALVVSHCLHTSTTTGRLRGLMRALCGFEMPPDELVTQLDSVVGRRFAGSSDLKSRVTLLCVVYDPVTRRCEMASAGHPPPALVLPDGTVAMVDTPVGPPLGLGGPFEKAHMTLPEGGVLALYTDSLIGHWGEDTVQGLAEFRRRLAVRADSLDQVCDFLFEGLEQELPGDDVVLLLARTRVIDSDHTTVWEFPVDPEAAGAARERTAHTLAEWGLDREADTTEIIVSELVTNALRHATGPIELRLTRHDHTLSCEVSDGSGTFPQLQRARLEDEGGRGLFMVAQLCRRWGTRPTDSGKVIWTNQAVDQAVEEASA
jgi:anti-sigma regulatory factor (Ser/Thr protein kinase)